MENNNNSIPKLIHYCWFGENPLPELAIRCIESWRKFLPEYKIIEWNESNFDVNSIKYTKEAYSKKKYAFVSDYARFWILYNYGGIYFDIDVELVRNPELILSQGPYMGLEGENSVEVGIVTGQNLGVECNPGLGMAALKGMSFCKKMIDRYHTLCFLFPSGALNTKTVVSYTSEELLEDGYDRTILDIQKCSGFNIYPPKFFCPVIDKKTGGATLSQQTISIHHYAGTWVDRKMKLKGKISAIIGLIFPTTTVIFIRKIWRIILRKDINI